MRRIITATAALAVLFVMAMGYKSWVQGRSDAAAFLDDARHLIAHGQGPSDLGAGRTQTFLAVKDPTFLSHNGVDMMHPRPFRRTLTQALAHTNLRTPVPGLRWLQEALYAIALDEGLPKTAQLALYLDTLPMGVGPDGQQVTGFFNASSLVFNRPPHALDHDEFLTLLSATLVPRPIEVASVGKHPEVVVHRARLVAFLEGDCQLNRPMSGLPEHCF